MTHSTILLDEAEQPDYHSFLVRVWRGPGGWHGEIHSLQQGTWTAFVGLRQLFATLRSALPRNGTLARNYLDNVIL